VAFDCSCHDSTGNPGLAISIPLALIQWGLLKAIVSGPQSSLGFFEPRFLGNLPLKNGHKPDYVLVSRAYFGPNQFVLNWDGFWLLFVFIPKNPLHIGIN
jgi:hypothetical protein